MTDGLYWKTASELSQMYRRREVSPVEVVDAVLDRMQHVQPSLNIMVTTTADQARVSAREAEARFGSGETLPPLFGVPMTVKDLAETAGVRTTYGSAAYVDHVPDVDAIGWERLKQQGVILLGKTTTPEFGLLGVTESKLTGSTSTPWRPGYAAGGRGFRRRACRLGIRWWWLDPCAFVALRGGGDQAVDRASANARQHRRRLDRWSYCAHCCRRRHGSRSHGGASPFRSVLSRERSA